jgi:outer membrane protein assembly factor BamB
MPARLSCTFFFAAILLGVAVFLSASAQSVQSQTDSDAIAEAIQTILAVGPEGEGNAAARDAYPLLAGLDVEQVPTLLDAFEGANPLAENWLRAAVDTICERTLNSGENLPDDRLEGYVLNSGLDPHARRLAYEWLREVDPAAENRIIPQMLHDASTEMRREAVAMLIEDGETRLDEEGDIASPARTAGTQMLVSALDAARDLDQIERLIPRVRQLGIEVNEPELFGYLLDWNIAGHFDNTEMQGFDVAYGPEKSPIDLAATYDGKHGPIEWTEHHTESPRGLVELNNVCGEEKDVIAYAYTTFASAATRDAQLRISTFNALQVWCNGQVVSTNKVYHGGSEYDQYIVPVELNEGTNTILLKICQNDQPQSWARKWDFKLRVSDEIGGAIASHVGVSGPAGPEGDSSTDGLCLQWGGGPTRNNVSSAVGLPEEWDVGKYDYRAREWSFESAEHLDWMISLGSECYGIPIVTDKHVFITTNNAGGFLDRFPEEHDLGVLLALDRETGEFIWQYSSEKLGDSNVDWPEQGICSTPLLEGDRLWVVSNENKVVCLDVNGFLDGENDGTADETVTTENEADVVWTFDIKSLGVVAHNMVSCSPASYGDLIFVQTSNGADENHRAVVNPEAPSFLCLDKTTGEVVWSDASPGENILDGQWSSPTVCETEDGAQVVFAAGDGWLYAFAAERTDDGEAPALWRFDCNPKDTEWEASGYGDRSYLVATPVVYDGDVFIATGMDPECGEAQGHLWRIDPNKRGDVSAELVIDVSGTVVPPKRGLPADEDAGEQIVPNPNSAAVWHYIGTDQDEDGELDFEETFHRTIGLVAIQDDILVVGDIAGLIHCLDASTSELLWNYDMMSSIWGAPLIADDKIFIGDAEGDVAVFALAREDEMLSEVMLGDPLYGGPVAVDGALYLAVQGRMFRIKIEE